MNNKFVNNKIITWQCVTSQPFDQNAYVAVLSPEQGCIVIDPGFEPDKIMAAVESANAMPVAILNTHGHSDHIAGNATMKEHWPQAPLIIGKGDAAKLTDPQLNLSATYGFPLVSPPADQTVLAGETIEFGGIQLSVRATPGHSPGHVIFLCQQHEPWVVFGGDVLFSGSIGRTDFADSDHEALIQAIHRELLTLPDDTIVLTGHGPPTTIGQERRFNPYVGSRS